MGAVQLARHDQLSADDCPRSGDLPDGLIIRKRYRSGSLDDQFRIGGERPRFRLDAAVVVGQNLILRQGAGIDGQLVDPAPEPRSTAGGSAVRPARR